MSPLPPSRSSLAFTSRHKIRIRMRATGCLPACGGIQGRSLLPASLSPTCRCGTGMPSEQRGDSLISELPKLPSCCGSPATTERYERIAKADPPQSKAKRKLRQNARMGGERLWFAQVHTHLVRQQIKIRLRSHYLTQQRQQANLWLERLRT
eukprot:768539-Hanusia_phi.AAC.3